MPRLPPVIRAFLSFESHGAGSRVVSGSGRDRRRRGHGLGHGVPPGIGLVQQREQLPHLLPQFLVGVRAVGTRTGQIVAPQRQPPRQRQPALHHPPRLDLRFLVVLADDLGRDRKRLPRLDKLAVLHVGRLAQHHHAVGEVLALADQPRAGLGHGLEHQHAGHDGKAGKMVGQVLFGQGQVFDRRNPHAGFQRDDPVQEHKSHETLEEYSACVKLGLHQKSERSSITTPAGHHKRETKPPRSGRQDDANSPRNPLTSRFWGDS